MDPQQSLADSLTKINPNDNTIDAFSDFPTPQAIELQINDRLLYELAGLEYYKHEADFIAEIMRGHDRLARQESVLCQYKSIDMFGDMVGVGANEYKKQEKRGEQN